MIIALHSLPKRPGRRPRRVGRGHGSGRGTYAGRGMKGQRARTGGRRGIFRRALSQTMSKLPKQRGIQSTKPKYVVVSLAFLDASFSAKDIVTPRALLSRGIRVREARGLKILGTGKITKALTVHAHAFSSSAKRAIEQAGGRAVKLARI